MFKTRWYFSETKHIFVLLLLLMIVHYLCGKTYVFNNKTLHIHVFVGSPDVARVYSIEGE